MTLKIDRFTDLAQELAAQAYQITQKYGHNQVDTIHLMLAFLEHKDDWIPQVLAHLKINIPQFQNRIERAILKIKQGENTGQVGQIFYTPRVRTVLEIAQAEANRLEDGYITSEHITLGMLTEIDTPMALIFKEFSITHENVTRTIIYLRSGQHITSTKAEFSPLGRYIKTSRPISTSTSEPSWNVRNVSPIFGALVSITSVAGYLIYQQSSFKRLFVFLFVIGGWIISVTLHEFGHALIAYLSGDRSVVEKGYLTLNPLKYTHGLLSVVYPILMVILGGIGLPGAAVYINDNAINSRIKRSLTSAAGPIVTGCFALILAIPFSLNLRPNDWFNHLEFWSGLALLLFLQISALFFNLLPIPGLDGFNTLSPFLPMNLRRKVGFLQEYTFLILMIIFLYENPLRSGFWKVITHVTQFIGLDMDLINNGYDLFRFWQV